MSNLDRLYDHIDRALPEARERWADFLRIPSISTDPAYRGETRRAAEWARDRLGEIGFDAALHDTSGHPMVVARDHSAGANAPTVLYYGHYDVQPADPVSLWRTGPFEPTLEDGPNGPRMIARGAVDDKGQVMTILEALRAWRSVAGDLPVNVTVFLEGEEESGSPSLVPFLKEKSHLLSADVCIVSDTASYDVDTPAITSRLRGMVYTELTVFGPDHDLHSGSFGGAVPNPLNALMRVLGDLHDENNHIQIPGFYDDVRALEPDIREQWAALEADEQAFLHGVGLEKSWGEAGYSLLERLWARPTADINGTIGGYTGAGAKTVIPAQASAKVSFRLVPDQQPATVIAGFQRFIEDRLPVAARFQLDTFHSAPAFVANTNTPYMAAARRALRDAYGREPALIGVGGSIPVVGLFKDMLDLDTLLVGFGLDDDRMHSPNEKFELICFERGIKSHVALIARLGERAA